ncbi:hypothetical protein PN417_09855 [Halorubrum ezzemoulense]|uniref:hypothetical protein n=1 Tax=Halorubrum ezzemoulense TaxID=337243 RepID=UPI00232D3CA7|nr:hypothetical protein [Halorubrum ezzemoulense]MDB9301238.1 hypothetical protein [Halorubrum ezzemoulense]
MRVNVRIDDPDIVEALEDAADDYGSKSLAVRIALRQAYIGDDLEEEPGDGETKRAHELSAKQLEAHRELRDWAGIGGWIELETAESVLANKLNIPARAVRKTLISPLKSEGAVKVSQSTSAVHVVVGQLPTTSEASETVNATNASDEAAVATDGGATWEELEAAEEER